MSSDSEKLPKPTKRRRQIVSDSESSDDSFIISNRGKRKVGRVVSEGESSDDGSDIPLRPVQKRKNHKLVSEDESSYDSSSSNECIRNNFDGGSTSAEWQSDWESMDESNLETPVIHKCKKSPNKDKPNSDSDNSDGESDKCPICLLSFRKQEIANPTVCEHCFCLDCLMEWSKNINTCPIDRQTFTVINVRAKIGGKIIRHVPIEPTTSQTEEVIQEDPTYCEVCQQCDREDRMLLCDGCDSGYHLECLDPPIHEVPLEEHWYCPECSRNTQNDAEDIDIDLDEVPDLIHEARLLGLSYGRSRASLAARGLLDTSPPGHGRRLIPRTRQTERIRANVRADRSRRAEAEVAIERIRQHREPQPSTSSGFDSISENSRTRSPIPGPSSSRRVTSGTRKKSSSRKLKVKRKSKKSTRRKTTKSKRSKNRPEFREVRISEVNENGELEEIVTYVRASTADGNGGPLPSGRRRKKRKTRRARTVASVAAARLTAKRRLAASLKILRPPTAVGSGGAVQLTPLMKNESGSLHPNSALRVARHQAGISQVSLFGSGLGLDYSPPG